MTEIFGVDLWCRMSSHDGVRNSNIIVLTTACFPEIAVLHVKTYQSNLALDREVHKLTTNLNSVIDVNTIFLKSYCRDVADNRQVTRGDDAAINPINKLMMRYHP